MFDLAPGFEIELVASEPEIAADEHGSTHELWVTDTGVSLPGRFK